MQLTVQIDFYTPDFKEPPLDIDLIVQLNHNLGWVIAKYVNDCDYGKILSMLEGYYKLEYIRRWAIIPDNE